MGEAGRSLTAVEGLAVGHAEDLDARTGCTAVLGPFRAAAEVRGQATGTREMDVLHGEHVVRRVDAVLLTGGSAFGLGAADGVMAWLEERGRGFETPASRVPIVPTAVLYDLGVGDGRTRPGPAMGREAADSASRAPVPEGRRGAGAGATVGNLLGPEGAEPGGVGSWAVRRGEHTVGALAVVNAFGDVRDGEGGIRAGARDADGEHADTLASLADGRDPGGWSAGGNTTLLVVATDRPVARSGLRTVARQAMNGVSRRVVPSGTLFDGDVAFALSTGGLAGANGVSDGGAPPDPSPGELVVLGAAAQLATERAVERAVAAGGDPAAGGAG